ncbi:MAG: pyridoxamine 5'-phosphate oxidase family protein [Vicinamibacteria bacterium]|nr:pyridoxamine 5'-phosphate oxidase family protein [Vicinamibacteria bacterium]
MKKLDRRLFCVGLVASSGLLMAKATPGEEKPAPASRDKLIAAARELIGTLKYCALITVDAAGQPQSRTMNPFPPEEDMSVWMATTKLSRKFREIERNPRVTLYYANHAEATGYVSLNGKAVLVDDMQEILKRKRGYWDNAFPGLKNVVLIKVIPERLEIVYYKHGLNSDSITFRAPSIDLTAGAARR